jgi:hypothetical protein
MIAKDTDQLEIRSFHSSRDDLKMVDIKPEALQNI